MRVILGVDPGSRVTGYGLVQVQGRHISYLASGCIRVEKLEMAQRLQTLYAELQTIISQYHPDFAAVEQVFVGRNESSALKLGQARGVALLALANAGLEIAEFSARSVKQAVAGSGAADKKQIQHMVTRLLKLDKTPPSDAADALAIAMCHGFTDNPYARAL